MALSRQVDQPKKYPEILLNDLVPDAGKKLFNYQLNAVIKNETGTKLGEDIEFLHDFRVATRRLRVAFQLFGSFYDPGIVSDFVPYVMNKTFGEVHSIGETLSDPSVTQLHELRIAFKKFRYTMEFFCNILGDEIFQCIKVIKEIQNYLGEINDLRIALEKLKKHRFRIGTKDSNYNFDKEIFLSEIRTYTKGKEIALFEKVDRFHDIWNDYDNERISDQLNFAMAKISVNED